MCDYIVHRCRLFNYLPSAIQCMVYNDESDELAVSRSNGSVEIWATKNIWFQKLVIPGSEKSNIQTLVWLGRSLFSGGLQGNILQYDLTKANVKSVTDSCGGAVWCLASSAKEDKLVAGCEDGSLKLFKLQNKKLTFNKGFSKQEGRILSVAWHHDDDIIVSGSCDLIRIWSVKTGHAIQRITLERLVRNTETIVWSVLILSDYTVVSGDSSGRIQFFNGKNATLIQSFQVHKADVLCLKANENEKSIYASGVDPQVVEFKLLHDEIDDGLLGNWVKGRALQKHTHDVRAISIVGDSVVSGGVDTNLLLRSMVANSSSFRRIHSFPVTPLVSCTEDLELFAFQYTNHLDVWYSNSTGTSEIVETNPIKVLQIKTPRNGSHIVCSSISNCGKWIVYSMSSSTKLFKLERDGFKCSLEKVSCTGLTSSHKIIFSPDSNLLIASLRNHNIVIVKLNSDSNEASIIQLLSVNSVDCITHLLSISSDSRFLASGNLQGKIQIHDLSTMTHYHTLPTYPQVPTSFAFHPQTNDLMIAYEDLQIFEFSLSSKQYTEWTKRIHQSQNPILLEINEATSHRKHISLAVITNISFNTQNGNDLVMFLSREGIYTLPKDMNNFKETDGPRFFRKFEPLLHCQLNSSGSLLVVERPFQEIWNSLPPNLYQKKFGT